MKRRDALARDDIDERRIVFEDPFDEADLSLGGGQVQGVQALSRAQQQVRLQNSPSLWPLRRFLRIFRGCKKIF